MAQETAKNAAGDTFSFELPLSPGRKPAAQSRPVAWSEEDLQAVLDLLAAVGQVEGESLASLLAALRDHLPESRGRKAAALSLSAAQSTEDLAISNAIKTAVESLVAAAAATGSLNMAFDTSAIANGADMLEPLYWPISESATGEILAGVVGHLSLIHI